MKNETIRSQFWVSRYIVCFLLFKYSELKTIKLFVNVDDLPIAEPSPLHTTTIVEKCTLKLVDDYKHMLCQATEPLSTFLEYITYVNLGFLSDILHYLLIFSVVMILVSFIIRMCRKFGVEVINIIFQVLGISY